MTKEEAAPIFAEAQRLRGEGHIVTRSCWRCNSSHEHLREVKDAVILCFACECWYFNGHNLTAILDENPDWASEPKENRQ